MFVDQANNTVLRQGDILQGLYYPLMVCRDLPLIGTSTDPVSVEEPLSLLARSKSKHSVDWLDAQLQVCRVLAIVLSQCCDLELRNEKLQINSFIVSPLLKLEYQITSDPERYETFKRNPISDYVNWFYLPHRPPLIDERMVDFNRLVSIPRAEYGLALRGKILQMTDEARVRLKVKLSQHFGRPLPEEQGLFAQLLPTIASDSPST
jgi:hypothetical protein